MMPVAEEQVEITIANNLGGADTKAKITRPPVTVGDALTWYLQGALTHPHSAIVWKVGERNISVMLQTPDRLGQVVDSVYHIDDPRLEENKNLKINNGAWDYTAQAKKAQTQQRITEEKLAALTKRVAELEDLLSKPERKKNERG